VVALRCCSYPPPQMCVTARRKSTSYEGGAGVQKRQDEGPPGPRPTTRPTDPPTEPTMGLGRASTPMGGLLIPGGFDSRPPPPTEQV
jgi:hypothetical protein